MLFSLAFTSLLPVILAFEDTSPFIYISTHQQILAGHNAQPALSSTAFRSSALSALSCDIDNTIIAIQPSVHASDFSDETAPLIRQYVSQAGSKIVVPYGHGEIDADDFASHIANQCDAQIERIDADTMAHPIFEDQEKRVIVVTFPTLPISLKQRKLLLNDNDAFLHSLVKSLPSSDFNLIYLSTPPPAAPASFRRAHIALEETTAQKHNTTTGGLFTHYQFFTPGIFMGYMTLLILVPVLIVGLQAINSIQVSYKAFEPPMKIGQKQQ